jgi:hypothetical protein
MGTNDFRSTKRRIRWAAVDCDDGPGVPIHSTVRLAFVPDIDRR